MRRRLAAVLACALSTSVLGAGASHWTHTSEADFKKGKFHNVVVSNLGDLKLSRAVKTLLEQDPRVSAVYALAEAPDGTIYAGTGPQGIVLQLRGEKVGTLLTLEDENVFSLLVDRDGKLLIGTGGEKGRILRLDKPGEKPTEVFSAEGVQYVWQIRQASDGLLYAATGPNGQIFEIKPDGSHSVLLDSDDNNILSLISDGGDMLYAGSDPNGLVYRINRKTKDVFVIYDAAEAEISTLALDAKGTLYAGTAQASDTDGSRPDELDGVDRAGRPEGADITAPLPGPKPKSPAPPETPKPDPNDPQPIPRSELKLMMLGTAPAQSVADDPGDADDSEAPGQAPLAPPSPEVPGAPGTPAVKRPAPPRGSTPRGMPSGMTQPAITGNAIYKIESGGFVTEVFRQPAMILSMVERDGILLVGTGSDGLVYQVNPAADEMLVLAKVDTRQVMSMLAAKDGRIILGLANVGGLASMSSGFATEGTYTSPVLDAAQISRFGKVRLHGSLPPGATLSVATRSGNLNEPGGKGWSKWSEEIPASEYVQVPSPSARFLQYRLTFTSKDGAATPVVDQVDVAHQLPNLAPQIKSVRITSAGDGEMRSSTGGAGATASRQQPTGRMRTIAWEATDANTDAMEYTLYFRSGARSPWILLAEKLKEPQYQWDTRGVPDGRYQIKVVASDAKSNPRGEGHTATRVSDMTVVDNTSPAIGDVKLNKLAKQVKIEAQIVDRASGISTVEYSVDSKDDWQAVPASDSIFDSPEEGISLTLDDLAAGAHQVTLRASDAYGNQAYETILVTVSPPGEK